LQSTNEELETSKEELQSANEELNTLNDELRHKNSELHDANNDLTNFFNSARLPLVMLDRSLRIRRLTPNADKLLKAAPSDIGRAVSDIRLNIRVSDLEAIIGKVLDTLQPAEREVQDLTGHWHTLHVLPYRTQDNKIEGAVLALQDIDAIKSANEQLRKSSEFFRGIIDTVREPLLVLDSTLRIMAANQSFLRTFAVSSEETVNKFLYRIGSEQWNIPKLRAMLERILPEKQVVTDFEVELEFPNIGHRTMLLNARRLAQTNNLEPMILLAIEDTTERKRGLEMQARLAAIVESSEDAIVGKDTEGVITSWNRGAERLFGYTAHEAIGRSITIIVPPDRLDEESEILAHIRRGERIEHLETVRRTKDGGLLDISLTISPLRDWQGQIVGASKIARDITDRKRAEEALRQSHAELQGHAEELERFNRLAVGREERMIELKKEVNELCRRHNEAARYPLEFEEDGEKRLGRFQEQPRGES
jgi:PAS domain S-box